MHPVRHSLHRKAEQSPAERLSPSSHPNLLFIRTHLLPHNRAMNLAFTRISSPVGTLKLVATDTALVAVVWRDHGAGQVPVHDAAEAQSHPVLDRASHQLEEYFAGRRREFDLPLEFLGTDFQRRAWRALQSIPYGETRTYADMARQIGQPTAVRAVGAANGRNPISIIVPCHRVIGSSGALTGFGGGLDAKAKLLALEAPQKSLLTAQA
jgi:methylated-DNA-[protein]-cysteine S-methyltransferase